MPYKVLRVLALTTLLAGILAVTNLTPARADYWGAWKWNGASGTADCLVAGTGIATGSTPDRHNVAASNTCNTDYLVNAVLTHYDAAGRVIDQCAPASATNYQNCSIKVTTGTGDYWSWDVSLLAATADIFCSNQGSSYTTCFSTDFP